VVINGTELTADFVVPSDASTGNYTLHVDDLSQANAFTVLAGQVPALASVSPDNAEQGTLVNTTITGENTSWEGGTPVVLLSLSANPSETIPGTNVVVVNNTTLTADFDIPFEATPGLWDLYADALVLENAFTVVDVIPVLVSIDPASATQGDQVTTLITATDSRFTLSAPEVSLSFPGLPGEVIEASQVNVLNDTQLEATFIIPENASPGLWDLHVDEMMLTGAFTVNLLIGLGDNLLALVSVYPNPAIERIVVENAHGADLSIYSSAGELVVARRIGSGKQTVDVSALPAGVYVVRLLMEGKAKIEKLLVN
jgi:hypothetical protein